MELHSQKSSDDDRQQLRELEARINAILPPTYVGCFEDVPPTSMGSAGLKFGPDGRVLWGEIWTSFCHLALAGGPPHRGQLLGPVTAQEAEANAEAQQAVVAEIERAIGLTADLPTVRSEVPGWVGVRCHDEDMAAWLVRAIVAENVIARRDGNLLFVPAGPHFRIEKEIKNVVVCLAKTCHYLLDHVEPDERPTGLTGMLIEPALPQEIARAPAKYQAACEELDQELRQLSLETVHGESPGWIGIQCQSEEMAVWMLRAIVVDDILARREGDVLYLPISTQPDSATERQKLLVTVAQAHRLWMLHFQETRGR